MYRLKIDITEKSSLTKTEYGKNQWNDIEEARRAATRKRKELFEEYTNGKIKDYRVDVIPCNE